MKEADFENFRNSLVGRMTRFKELAGRKIPLPIENAGDLETYVEGVCARYRGAQAGEREQIRAFFADEDANWFLHEFIRKATAGIRREDAKERLLQVLAGVSIADARPDYRDTLYVLGYVYRAAQQAGIRNPMPEFHWISRISRNEGPRNASGIMATFDETAVCEELREFSLDSLAKVIRTGDATTLRAYIEDGIDVNRRDENGRTPLMDAARFGRPGIVEIFISAGAEVNAKDCDGGTALVYAASRGHVSALQKLLEAGAKVDVNPSGMNLMA